MANDTPKISVIIPVYNVQDFLKECLDSLINQSLRELEFICINDGSTDSSLEILNEYANKDNRFTIINQENQGQGIARNKAIKMSKGQYIAFVDPDDWINLDAFEILYNKLKETNVDLIIFDYETFTERKSRTKSYSKTFRNLSSKRLQNLEYFTWKDFNKKNWMQNGSLAVWNKIYRTDFIKNNNIQFAPNKHGEDHIFSISATMLADKILYLKEVLYHYRSRIGSAVNKASDDNFCIFENIEILKKFLESQDLFDSLYSEFMEYKISVLAWHYTCIPSESIGRYLNKCCEILSKNEFKLLRKKIKRKNNSFVEKIFSLKNGKKFGKKYKIVTILGISFSINKPKGGNDEVI